MFWLQWIASKSIATVHRQFMLVFACMRNNLVIIYARLLALLDQCLRTTITIVLNQWFDYVICAVRLICGRIIRIQTILCCTRSATGGE